MNNESPRAFFTSFTAEAGDIHFLDDHLQRLAEHAAHFAVPLDRGALKSEIAARFADTIAPERGRVTVALPSGEWHIERLPMPPQVKTIKLRLLEIPRPLGPWKTLPRPDIALSPGEEVLLCDPAGRVYEGSYTSIFLCKEKAVLTPVADGTILTGIMRKQYLQELKTTGISVTERPLFLSDLDHAQIRLTNAVRGVVPAVLSC